MADIDGSNGQRTEFKAVGRSNVSGSLSYTIATGGAKFGTDVVVCDPGKVLRMTSFEGQLHQAMFFSQGGLSEEFTYDKGTG